MANSEKVLVLSDNPVSTRIAKDAFNQVCSNEVIVCDCIDKAKQEFENNEVIFFVINLINNTENSLTFIKSFRRDNLKSSFKIPVLSIVENEEFAKESIDAGSTKYIEYPFGIGRFKEILFEIVNEPKKFIVSDNYVGPDRRDKTLSVRQDRRLKRNSSN